MLTCSLIFPYYQWDPTIFNKVLHPQLETNISLKGHLILHTLLDMARKRELKKKFKIKKLDVFNKGGNCKLQEGILINIEKTSMGKFNKGGNCKLQFPEVIF